MLRSLLILMALMLAVPALAQTEPAACVRDGEKWDIDFTKLHRQEAERPRSVALGVSRLDERLTLGLEDGKTIVLADCPFGDAGHYYLFERYDEAGRFYVLGRSGYEDFRYTLVMRRTGRRFDVEGLPIWSIDKSRFLTVGCAIANDQKTLRIYASSSDSYAAEAAIPLPCDMESCAARWDNPSWISVSCTPLDDQDKRKKGTEFVVLRGSDGIWKRFGR